LPPSNEKAALAHAAAGKDPDPPQPTKGLAEFYYEQSKIYDSSLDDGGTFRSNLLHVGLRKDGKPSVKTDSRELRPNPRKRV
jgi:hypothetical protein